MDARMTADTAPYCDHHELPFVCGECGEPHDSPGWAGIHYPGHDWQPVHVLADPEGVVPCPLGGEA